MKIKLGLGLRMGAELHIANGEFGPCTLLVAHDEHPWRARLLFYSANAYSIQIKEWTPQMAGIVRWFEELQSLPEVQPSEALTEQEEILRPTVAIYQLRSDVARSYPER